MNKLIPFKKGFDANGVTIISDVYRRRYEQSGVMRDIPFYKVKNNETGKVYELMHSSVMVRMKVKTKPKKTPKVKTLDDHLKAVTRYHFRVDTIPATKLLKGVPFYG